MTPENLYTPDCIRTVSGIYVNVFDPKPEMFELADIGWALSRMQRFTGHLQHSYSILQHSLFVAGMVPKDFKLAALLHEASEAYIHDIASPIKNRMPEYRSIEDGLMQCIAEKFGFEYPLNPTVKFADKIALEWEWDTLMLRGENYETPINDVRSIWFDAINML